MNEDDRKKILNFLEEHKNTLYAMEDAFKLAGIEVRRVPPPYMAAILKRKITKVSSVPYNGTKRTFYGITTHSPDGNGRNCFYSWCTGEQPYCPLKLNGKHSLKFHGVISPPTESQQL